METLEDFIKRHTQLVKTIIYKSNFYRLLDHDDVSELIYTGLWKAYRFYNPQKSSVNTFITKIINNYMITLAKKKSRYNKRHVPLDMQFDLISSPPSEVSDHFTEDEWAVIQPLYEGHSLSESSKIRGLSRSKYRKVVRKISQRVAIRNR